MRDAKISVMSYRIVSAPAAKQAQHEEEHVDEIKVESECAEDAILGGAIALGVHLSGHAGDALRVEGGEAGEDQHARDTDDEIKRSAGEEDVNDHGDQQSNDAHHQEGAHLGEVNFGGVTDDGHGSEQCGGRDERQEYRSEAEGQQDDGKCESVQGSIDKEEHGGRAGGDLIEAPADAHHQSDLGDHCHDQYDRVEGEIDQRGADRDVRKAGGDQHTQDHPSIDSAHDGLDVDSAHC